MASIGFDDQRQTLFDVADDLLEIGNRLQGLFIAVDTDHADAGARHVLQHAIHHAKAGTQDGYDGYLLAFDLVNFYWPIPAIDDNLLGFEVRGRFIGQQTAHFFGQFTETLGADIAFTHQTDLVFDQGVFDFNDFHYYLL